jgi:GT2 family glycosyltransferase
VQTNKEMKIITLATCFNRVDKTLRSMQTLHNQALDGHISIIHFLVDDGSTDGTKETILDKFPETVILQGSGDLYWAGGMRLGFNAIENYDYDFLLAYNDDVEFYEDTIQRLVDCALKYDALRIDDPIAIVGSCCSEDGNQVTYGGRKRKSIWNPLGFYLCEPKKYEELFVDTFNMNILLLPKVTLKKVGFLADYFVHSSADYEFGLRIKKHGGRNIVAPKYFGRCNRDDDQELAYIKKLNVLGKIRFIFSPKIGSPRQMFKYFSRYGGILWPILLIGFYLKQFVRVF